MSPCKVTVNARFGPLCLVVTKLKTKKTILLQTEQTFCSCTKYSVVKAATSVEIITTAVVVSASTRGAAAAVAT